MRNDDSNSDRVSRRDILKKTSIGATAGIAGVSQPVFAERNPDRDRLDGFESDPKVRSVLAELELDGIPRSATARTKEIEGPVNLAVTSIELEYGTLQIGELNGEMSATLLFGNTDPTDGKGKTDQSGKGRKHGRRSHPNRTLPDQYSEIPAESDAWILGSRDGATFLRTATSEERRTILSQLPVADTETTLVYTRSDIDGFRVDVTNYREDHDDVADLDLDTGSTAEDETGMIRYTVPTTKSVSVTALSMEATVASRQIQPQFISNPAKTVAKEIAQQLGFASLDAISDHCGWAIGSCVTGTLGSISGCAKCAPACLGSVSGVGAVICFLCVFGVCSHLLTGVSCAQAMDCVEG